MNLKHDSDQQQSKSLGLPKSKSLRSALHRVGRGALAGILNRLVGVIVPATIAASVSSPARATEEDFLSLLKEITGGVTPIEGGISIETPRLADNGHSAALRLSVQSPMNADDYVQSIYILSDRNPRPFMARYDLTPVNVRAEISTRVRLNGSQNVHALALNSRGVWYTAHVPVEVTESACLDAT